MIRRAVRDDATGIREMSSDLARRGPIPRTAFDVQLARALGDDRSVLLVAEERSRLIGYALGFVAPMLVHDGFAFLQELYVVPDRRGSGIGRDLVEAFEHAARSGGAHVVALASSRANAFYDRLGFDDAAVYFRRDIGSVESGAGTRAITHSGPHGCA